MNKNQHLHNLSSAEQEWIKELSQKVTQDIGMHITCHKGHTILQRHYGIGYSWQQGHCIDPFEYHQYIPSHFLPNQQMEKKHSNYARKRKRETH